jgi:hypothetical protein
MMPLSDVANWLNFGRPLDEYCLSDQPEPIAECHADIPHMRRV